MSEIRFAVKVVPRARRDEIVGLDGDVLKVRLCAPPVEGRANQALIRLLAQAFGVPRSNVEILQGEGSRHKLVRVRGGNPNLLLDMSRGV